jgi:hypothetical protein
MQPSKTNRLPHVARLGAATLVFIMAAAVIQVPVSATLPASTDPCAGYETLSVPTFEVPLGAVRVFDQPTKIKADTVQVLGTLMTKDASPGKNAPGLCIEAESYTVTGTICTGSGHDGEDRMAVGSNQTVQGGAGTNGGPLHLTVIDNPLVPGAPSFNVVPGAICTGQGGDGGGSVSDSSGIFTCLPRVNESLLIGPQNISPGVQGLASLVYCLLGGIDMPQIPDCEQLTGSSSCVPTTPTCQDLVNLIQGLSSQQFWGHGDSTLTINTITSVDLLRELLEKCGLQLPTCEDLTHRNPCLPAIPSCEDLVGDSSCIPTPPCEQSQPQFGSSSCVPPLPCDQIVGTSTCIPRTPTLPCDQLVGTSNCIPRVPNVPSCENTPARNICDPGSLCQNLMYFLADLLYNQHQAAVLGSSNATLDYGALNVVGQQTISECNPPPTPVPSCQQVTGYSTCTPPLPDLLRGINCGPISTSNICGVGVCQSEDGVTASQGGNGGEGGLLSLNLPPDATVNVPSRSLLLGSGGRGGNAFTFGTPYGSNNALGGNGGGSAAEVNGAMTSEQLSWFSSGVGGQGGSGFAESANCIPLPCALEALTWCVLDYVVQQVCSGAPTPPSYVDVSVSDFCTDAQNLIERALSLDVPLIGTPGSAATGATGPALGGGDGANGAQGKSGVDMSADIGASGRDGGVGLSCSVQDAGSGANGRSGGSGDFGSATGGTGGLGLLRGGDGGHAGYTASNGGGGGVGGRGGNGAKNPICTWDRAQPGAGGDGGDGGASGPGRSQGGAGGPSFVIGGRGGDASGTTGAPGHGGAGGSGGAGSYGSCAPFSDTICFDPPGAQGCGGRSGNVGVVHVQGGPGGENLLIGGANKLFNGPDGTPPPATNGLDLPAQAPPQTHGPPGGGSPRSPACPP